MRNSEKIRRRNQRHYEIGTNNFHEAFTNFCATTSRRPESLRSCQRLSAVPGKPVRRSRGWPSSGTRRSSLSIMMDSEPAIRCPRNTMYQRLRNARATSRPRFLNFNNDPNFRINAAAQALLNKVPLRRRPCRAPQFAGDREQRIDTNQYNARVDHQLSIKDSAFARASVFDANEFDPFGSSVLNEPCYRFGRTCGRIPSISP